MVKISIMLIALIALIAIIKIAYFWWFATGDNNKVFGKKIKSKRKK